MSDHSNEIARINALTSNARNTWFALLGVLVFVGITLMGVEDIDFYGVDRATKLPLVDVDVPTRYFFVAAPILTAAIYGYFHLYLIRLWDALSAAPSQVDGAQLGDAISPWLIADAALHIRRAYRKDNCTTARTLETMATILNICLAWGFGLVVLYLLWTVSFAARTFWMSGIAGGLLGVSVLIGFTSFVMMLDRMGAEPADVPFYAWSKPSRSFIIIAWICFIIFHSYQRTEGPPDKLAALSLSGENIVERPPGWLPFLIARKDFLVQWCAREQIADCSNLSKLQENEFRAEWYGRRQALRKDLSQPDWNPTPAYGLPPKDAPLGLDLRNADLRGTFLVNANMSYADLSQANLSVANLEGADFSNSTLSASDFSSAFLHETVFNESNLPQAKFTEARAPYAVFWFSNLSGANLRKGDFSHATFFSSDLTGADFTRALMFETDLAYSDLSGARLDYAFIYADGHNSSLLQSTKLNGAVNAGGALRNVDLSEIEFDSETDFRNVFLDGSVKVSPEFRKHMGHPCQWADAALTDQAYFARWRWWLGINPDTQGAVTWASVAPPGWADVDARVPVSDDCVWKDQPLPSADN